MRLKITHALLATLALSVGVMSGCDDDDDDTPATIVDAGAGGEGGAGGAVERSLSTIQITPAAQVLAEGDTVQLTATGTYSDGTTGDLSAEVTWASADAALTVSDAGLVTAITRGTSEISATLGETSGSQTLTVGCVYPSFPRTVQFGRTMPALYWDNAYQGGEHFGFKLEDVYCDDATYGDVQVIAFVVGAGWCSACTSYTQNILEPEYQALVDAGVLVVFLEAQDYNYLPTDSAFANRHLTSLVGPDMGVRIGSLDTLPVANFLTDETDGYIQAFPTVFVVRRSDMQIIADGTRSNYYLPLADIAANPEADWSNPDAPAFESQCSAGRDATNEPNNTAGGATAIEVGAFDDGICDRDADYFRVNVEGPWMARIEFSHAQGNLDMYLWDELADGPAQDADHNPVWSVSDTDVEQIEGDGPGVIKVEGYRSASADYTFTLSPLN